MVGANGQKLTLKGEVWENYYRLKDERGLKQKRQEEQVRIFESFYGIHFFLANRMYSSTFPAP